MLCVHGKEVFHCWMWTKTPLPCHWHIPSNDSCTPDRDRLKAEGYYSFSGVMGVWAGKVCFFVRLCTFYAVHTWKTVGALGRLTLSSCVTRPISRTSLRMRSPAEIASTHPLFSDTLGTWCLSPPNYLLCHADIYRLSYWWWYHIQTEAGEQKKRPGRWGIYCSSVVIFPMFRI